MNSDYLEQHDLYRDHFTRRDLPYPTAINIELTTYCNLHCVMCPKTAGIARTPSNRTMPDAVLDKIISEVVPRIFRIDLVGDGEILLVPQLVETVLKAASKFKVLVNASTNGVLLTEPISDMLVKGQLHDLNISLDAADPETYRSIRGADLESVLQNVRILNRIKSRMGSPYPRLQFSMVGMKRNIDQLHDLVDLAARLDAKSIMVQAMGEFDTVPDESAALHDRAHGRACVEKAREAAAHSGIAIHLWPSDQFDEILPFDDSSGLIADAPVRLKDCYFPWDVPYFSTDGSVRPCCAMSPLGDLNTHSFEEIWNGVEYSQLRSMMKSRNPPDECRICPGRGWYRPANCRDELLPGRDDRQFGTGWFETETYKGEHYRWARENAVFFIAGAGPGIMEIEIHTVWDVGTTQTIRIRIDDEPAHTIEFDYGQRRIVRLPVNGTGDLHQVRITGNGWRPVLTVPGELDPRSISVMFYGARMRQGIQPVSFDNAYALRDCRFHETEPDGDLNLDLFWEPGIRFNDCVGQFFHVLPAYSNLQYFRLRQFEILRKLDSLKRFQLDLEFPRPVRAGEIFVQSVRLIPPTGWSPGQYDVYMGLLDRHANRLHPSQSDHMIYRSSIRLGGIRFV